MFKIKICDSYNPNYRTNSKDRYYLRFKSVPIFESGMRSIVFDEVRFTDNKKAFECSKFLGLFYLDVFNQLDNVNLKLKALDMKNLAVNDVKHFIHLNNESSRFRMSILTFEKSWLLSDLHELMIEYLKTLTSIVRHYYKKYKDISEMMFRTLQLVLDSINQNKKHLTTTGDYKNLSLFKVA